MHTEIQFPIVILFQGNYPCNNMELLCENSGFCVIKNGRPQCECQEGYLGETCQISINETNSSSGNWPGKLNIK